MRAALAEHVTKSKHCCRNHRSKAPNMSSFVWSSKDRLVQMSAIRWISADYAVLKNSGLWDQKPSVGGSSPSLPPASSSMPKNFISLSSSGGQSRSSDDLKSVV